MTDLADPSASSPRAYSDVVYVFEPNAKTVPPWREYSAEVWERRKFLVALAKADLRGPRASTVIGELWGVVDPLFQAGIYWFLFTVIRGSQNDGGVFLSLVVSSIFLFNFTRIALTQGGRGIIRGKGLMLNSTFPRALLPLASVYKALLECAPSVPIYVIIHVFLLRRPIGPGIFLLPLLFVIQVVLTTGMTLLFAALTVYIRDMSNLLDYLMRILMFVTPVIYPVTLLSPTLMTILKINPFFTLFAAYQAIILGGTPSMSYILQSAVWAVLFLVLGYRVFVSLERSFALRL